MLRIINRTIAIAIDITTVLVAAGAIVMVANNAATAIVAFKNKKD
jgi:hypothetical protein